MEFWRFRITEELGSALDSSYHPGLVVLSIVVASLAALAALAVVDRIVKLRRRDGAPHRLWLSVGAFAMGSGIWAMHFTAMLAYDLPVRMSYSLPVTLVSMAPAMIGSWSALTIMSRETVEWWRLQIGGLFMAVGIGTMHYTGMEAMILDAALRYEVSLFALSIVVAHVLATVSLYVRFAPRSGADAGIASRLLSACVMGSAVAGMHYTAMAAARFYPAEGTGTPDMLLAPGLLAVLIAVIVVLITGLTIVGAVVDQRLTEASDSVLESATRYKTVLATMADGFIVLREDATVETFNPAAEKMFGVSASETIGLPFRQLVDEGKNASVLRHFAQTGDSYLIDYGEDVKGRRSGETFPLDLALSRMQIGGESFYTCAMRDISERRALERQLSNAQKLESIGQLAAGIAHEINTPTQYVSDNTRFLQDAFQDLLAPLKMLNELAGKDADAIPQETIAEILRALGDSDAGYLIEEIPQAIDQCLDGLGRVAKIVRAMKEFSHPSTEKTSVDINRAIESTVTISSNEWKYVAETEMDLDPELPHVNCLPGEFNQAILNIIVNAAQAIGEVREEGGEKGHIKVTTRRVDDWVEIRIADDGPGIPEHVKRKVFDPFFTTKDVGKGTGQGLSIAHAVIVQKHAGTLTVESEPGKGSCFIMRLPIDEPVPAEDALKAMGAA